MSVRLFLSLILFYPLFALEIYIDSAKEDFQRFSILHIKEKESFMCEPIKDDFDETIKVVCAFTKQPTHPIKPLENDFFSIKTVVKDKTFFIVIKPFHKMKLFPMIFDLTKDSTVYEADIKLSKHWFIVGYLEKLPLLESNKDGGLNFPFFMEKDKLPYVGSLDINGNPVYIKKVQDVSDYLKIKKLFKEKKYDLCLELIEQILQEYPNSLFKAELIYYKIKVYSALKDYDNVIEQSKEYLREYSSDENIPEVLSLTAKAYSKIGLNSDADYFFDRLFTEHSDSVYTQWGYIYKADMLDDAGGSKKAVVFYKKALDETSNLDVAVSAAYKLAQHYINMGSTKKSAQYIKKIIKAKPEFFIENRSDSFAMMQNFVDIEDYKTASQIATALLDNMSKKDEKYEELLKNKALWLAKTDDKKGALKAIDEYLKLYKYGTYEDVIKVAKDELFFDTNNEDENLTAQLQKYDSLIEEYKNDTIGDRALYEKAKLLLKHKMYSDVLELKDSILALDSEIYKDTKQIVTDAVIGMMESSLEKKECQNVLNLSNEYNITLSDRWDDGIYSCAMKGGDFLLSKKIANKHLKAKNIEQRKKWLYRYIKIDFATGNYSDVITASKDLISICDGKLGKYKDVYRILFDAYSRTEQKEKLIEAISDIEKVFGTSYKDIDRYVEVMSVGSEQKDDNLVIKYGKKIMDTQNRIKAYPQSPFVEFTLYQAYINKEDFNKAYEVIKSLDKLDLNKEDRARQKYLLGSVLSKLWRDDEATKAYKESIQADPNSPWAKLSQSAKEI